MNLEWRAIYIDGTQLTQYNENGTENKYQDIDRANLVRFDLLKKDTKHTIFSVYLREGQRLIYRRRTLVNMGNGSKTLVYLVGWQQTVYTNAGPKNVTAINYVYEDGSIALDGARNNLELLGHEL